MGIKKPKFTHGGAREGSGRPKKPPTVTVSFRIKPSQVKAVKKAVAEIVKPKQ